MIIKEIEELSDMSRANIRFYEKEGLLMPHRNENGYRDYSDQDLDTLRKIKLLRQLHLSVDMIKQIQQGTEDLGDALQTQIEQLGCEIVSYTRAQNICQSIKNDQVDYDHLDPQKYSTEIEALMDNGAAGFSITNDKEAYVPHPWRRYFARTFDQLCYTLMWLAFSHLMLRWNPSRSTMIDLLDLLINSILMLAIEPLLLSIWGTTPGKWVFGLSIRNAVGNKLTYGQSLFRTFDVWHKGMGYNIPFYSIYREYKCYGVCMNQEAMPWDQDEDFSCNIKDTRMIRSVGYVGMTAGIIGLCIIVLLQAQMPIHRGNLTPVQYYENCNDIASYMNMNLDKYLNNNGKWVSQNNGTGNTFVISIVHQDYPMHMLTISRGIVTGVKIEMKSDKNEIIAGYDKQIYMAVMSFLVAQKGMNFISLHRSGLLGKISHEFQNFSFVEAGIRVTNEVHYSGYDLLADHDLLLPNNGEPQHFQSRFTMEKVQKEIHQKTEVPRKHKI